MSAILSNGAENVRGSWCGTSARQSLCCVFAGFALSSPMLIKGKAVKIFFRDNAVFFRDFLPYGGAILNAASRDHYLIIVKCIFVRKEVIIFRDVYA